MFSHRRVQGPAHPEDQLDLVPPQPRAAGRAVGLAVMFDRDRRRRRAPLRQGSGHTQVEGVAEHGQFDRVGRRHQQAVRQQPRHQRHDPGDVAVPGREVAFAVEIGEEKLRGRPHARLGQEVLEAVGQAPGLPGPQQRQGRQPVARFAFRIVQGLLPGQPLRQAMALEGVAHGVFPRRQ